MPIQISLVFICQKEKLASVQAINQSYCFVFAIFPPFGHKIGPKSCSIQKEYNNGLKVPIEMSFVFICQKDKLARTGICIGNQSITLFLVFAIFPPPFGHKIGPKSCPKQKEYNYGLQMLIQISLVFICHKVNWLELPFVQAINQSSCFCNIFAFWP